MTRRRFPSRTLALLPALDRLSLVVGAGSVVLLPGLRPLAQMAVTLLLALQRLARAQHALRRRVALRVQARDPGRELRQALLEPQQGEVGGLQGEQRVELSNGEIGAAAGGVGQPDARASQQIPLAVSGRLASPEARPSPLSPS